MSQRGASARVGLALVLMLLMSITGLGCGSDGGRDEGRADVGQADGGLADAADVGGDAEQMSPRGTPPEMCPSEAFVGGLWFSGQGICKAEAPKLADWNCPDGWPGEMASADEDDASLMAQLTQYTVCQIPELPADCAAGSLASPGEVDCIQQSGACPADGELWREEQSIRQRADGFDGRIFYAAPDAQSGAAGTRAEPVMLSEALSDAADGDIIALSAGEFTGGATLEADAALIGACVTETTIRPASDTSEAALALSQTGGALVADLSVLGGQPGVSVVDATGMNRLEGVRVEGASFVGINIEGTSIEGGTGGVSASEVVVAGTESRADDGAAGYGIHVSGGAQLELVRGWLAQNRAVGVLIQGAQTSVDIVDTGIVGTRHQVADGGFGAGVVAGQGATLSLERVLVRGNRHTGVMVEGSGTTAAVVDVVVAATRAQQSDDRYGFGLTVTGGASADIQRTRLEQNRVSGLAVSGEDTSVHATDVLLRGTQPELADASGGFGAQVDGGATLQIERGWLDMNHSMGVAALDPETEVELVDTLISRTQADEDGARGFGLHIVEGANLQVTRGHLHQNRVVGLLGDGAQTSMALTDITVTETRPQEADDAVGTGILVSGQAELVVERGWMEQNRSSGLWTHGEGTLAQLTDLVVLETQPQQSDGRFGDGITMQKKSEIDLTRGWLSSNHQLGLASWGESHGQCTDLVISGTVASTLGFGDGAFLLEESDIEFDRTVVRDNERHGIVVSNAGAILSQSLITHNKVGLVRQEQTDVVVRDSRIQDNEQAEEQCELQCYDEPPASAPVEALPSAP